MSYDTEKVRLGGEPLTACRLTMDYCAEVSGVGSCTATETGDDKCRNTRATCNDTPNYNKTTKQYVFCQPRSSLPKGVNMFPVIKGDVKKAATSTTAGSGLGKRAVVRVTLNDFVHHDRGIDPYFAERTFNAVEQGTFWGKFLTNNPYYEGRLLEVGHGYIGDAFSFDDFEWEKYDIIDIDGVKDKSVTITAKDVLVRTYDRKSQYPVLSTGSLLANIAAGAATGTLTPTGIGASEYPASGTLSIGKDVKTFTRSGDVLTFTAHGQWGTEDKAHEAGDTVQICELFNENIVDALDRILTTGAGLPSSYIPTAAWDAEKNLWLSNATVYGILIKPESIEKVIGEWSEVFMLDVWWNSVDQQVDIKALSPEPSGATINSLTEAANIKQGSLKIDRKSENRFTEIRVGYNKTDYSEKNDIEQFASWQISADASRAGSDRYDGNSVKTILSRWFILQSNANQLAGRTLARFSDTPETITFKLDQKDHGKVSMAERVELNSWQFQDKHGANESRRYQILEINEGNEPGHDFTVKALTSSFSGRYFFVAPDATPDYSSATESQKEAYGFISLSTGLFADGTQGYKVI